MLGAFQEEVGVGAEARVNFALLEAQGLGRQRYHIVDSVVGVDNEVLNHNGLMIGH